MLNTRTSVESSRPSIGKFRYLSLADVESLQLGMRDVLDSLHEGFRLKGLGKTEMPPKVGIHPMQNSFIHAMPAFVEGHGAGLKWVSGFPANAERKLSYINGLMILNDTETGLVKAVMDCAWITAIRTGASVGISAKYLAKPDSSSVAVIACGVQARMSLSAVVNTLSQIKTVYCFDVKQKAAESFVAEMHQQYPQLQFHITGTAVDACAPADVVVTSLPIVTDPKPPLDLDSIRPGSLAVSLDYDSAWTSKAMHCGRFFCDDEPQLLYTKQLGHYFGGIPAKIDGDLGELCAGLKPGRTTESERIFCMNMGIAIDDIMVAEILLERALSRGIGRDIEL